MISQTSGIILRPAAADASETLLRRRKQLGALCLTLFGLSAVLLLAVPEARNGFLALGNRLFAASEAINMYAYARLPAPPGQSVALAACLLTVMLAALTGWTVLRRSRLLPLAGAILLAGGQAWFGLSLPAWANILAFAALGLGCLRPAGKRGVVLCLAAALAISLAAVALLPGIHPPVENASEWMRDRLEPHAQGIAGSTSELSEDAAETRRVNTQSLREGAETVRPERDYRLVTVEEEQISRPHWVDYLRIVLLLLLTIALVILPFLPFLALNARWKKAQGARKAFEAEDVPQALCAMFRHAAAYPEAAGCGGGNRPYRAWAESLPAALPEEYKKRWEACAVLFEEAAYSGHPLGEEQRRQMRDFLEQTEAIFYDGADWRQKLRLKYGKCLHE